MSKILIVDDETQILKVMTRLFMETDYEILTAENGFDALKLMAENEVDLIISDMKMPLMDGYELLNKVKEQYPDTIRISLSGYAEEASMFRASIHNIADFNIFKPWNNQNLLENIRKIMATHASLNSEGLDRIKNTSSLQYNIPQNCKKLLELIDEEKEDLLVSEIEQDPEISHLLMKIANSAIYGAMPGSVKQAALYIGMHNLKCFLRWAAMTMLADCPDRHEDVLELLWKQAYSTNKIMLFLYEALLHKQPPEASLFAGLLHNAGLIALYKGNPQLYQNQFNTNSLMSQDILALENSKLGITHQEVGGYLLNQWDLPFSLVEAALYHHRPLDTNIINTELVASVHISQYYSWKFLLGKEHVELEEEIFDRLGVSQKDFEIRLERYMKKVLLV